MITADTLATLTTLDTSGLAACLADSGYEGWGFKSVRFLGITNGGQFCYSMVYDDPNMGEQTGKVFLTYNHATGLVIAEY